MRSPKYSSGNFPRINPVSGHQAREAAVPCMYQRPSDRTNGRLVCDPSGAVFELTGKLIICRFCYTMKRHSPGRKRQHRGRKEGERGHLGGNLGVRCRSLRTGPSAQEQISGNLCYWVPDTRRASWGYPNPSRSSLRGLMWPSKALLNNYASSKTPSPLLL